MFSCRTSNRYENILTKRQWDYTVIMKKKLSRYSTINTIKNCHKSQHNGENHKFYTHSGEFQLPIYFRQKPTLKINKGTNNETLVYKEKN